jgi:hypothetical protein
MALIAGSAETGEGLAGAIANARKEAYGDKYKLKDDAKAIDLEAAAIIDYLVSNAEVEVTGVQSGGDTASGSIS